jgi:peptidoglycan-associated lipoprotein
MRETIDDEWGTPTNLGPKINGPGVDACASISFDGLELYFNSRNRPGGHGDFDIWVSKRQTKEDDWGAPVNLGPTVNGLSLDGSPWISTDNLELYFSSDRAGGYGSDDIWVGADRG